MPSASNGPNCAQLCTHPRGVKYRHMLRDHPWRVWVRILGVLSLLFGAGVMF
ncbi:hypothetical protein HYPSUDRAFT_818094 [Hypholoma sublateritium FD-334 SS-4]|uniref:Uncharacterized protein n=1 Tax=Hypholoma sublateritium (strain FD-334 SS-4) TaxID=945553 RepID=A0A0D2PK79_HYPSF|nr:hypothetical protein HYPSUDRAFT_818094 [Hypholoma sublateritium FD-334 SS-4]